jgi:AraC-like DNA-binding protein
MRSTLGQQPGQILAGRYRLEAVIGSLGAGEVWRGFDLRLNRVVTVKTFAAPAATDQASVAAFRLRAEKAAAVRHPAVETMLDIGTAESPVFLVTEYLEGQDLKTALAAQGGGLSVEQVTSVAEQALDAMTAAHAQSVFHGGLTSADLFPARQRGREAPQPGRRRNADGFRRSPGKSVGLEVARRMLVLEMQSPSQGSAVMVARILDLVFIQILRARAAGTEAEPNWLAGAFDPQSGLALSAIHRDPGHDWAVEELARACSLSRSAFAARFVTRVGMPSAAYLAHVRLDAATDLLRGTSLPVALIAQRVGYTSEAAFSRAFKNRYGMPPTRWRRDIRGR